eukprot:scaffold303722_cov28-Tisochrysis_lutea.AAC.1
MLGRTGFRGNLSLVALCPLRGCSNGYSCVGPSFGPMHARSVAEESVRDSANQPGKSAQKARQISWIGEV